MPPFDNSMLVTGPLVTLRKYPAGEEELGKAEAGPK